MIISIVSEEVLVLIFIILSFFLLLGPPPKQQPTTTTAPVQPKSYENKGAASMLTQICIRLLMIVKSWEVTMILEIISVHSF